MIKNTTNFQEKLETLLSSQSQLYKAGKVADYIPALAEVEANKMGVCVATIDG